jgi:Na+/alanine symporter
MLGATTAVLLHGPGAPLWMLVLLGAGGCLVLRLLAMSLGWRAPLPRGPASL